MTFNVIASRVYISIHALLAESDLFAALSSRGSFYISIHALLAESDIYPNSMMTLELISIHALLAESDKREIKDQIKTKKFLSTLSLRRATILCVVSVQIGGFLSTLSLRRATECTSLAPKPKTFLSTLSLRRATGKVNSVLPGLVFLSTLSLRRATDFRCPIKRPIADFYPRSPCGERG